jgi:hypothetical protein
VDDALEEDVLKILKSSGKDAWRIGYVKQSAEKVLSIPQKRLRGHGKQFHRS